MPVVAIGSRDRSPVMRFRIAAAIAAVTLTSAGTAGAATPSSSVDRIQILVFATPLDQFLDQARRPSDQSLDWSSDLCSAPLIGSTGRSFDFSGPCRRHDFAYRNFKRADQGRPCRTPPTGGVCRPVYVPSGRWWNSAIRHRIDRQFLADMLLHCATRSGATRLSCQTWAQIFYRSVRVAGGP